MERRKYTREEIARINASCDEMQDVLYLAEHIVNPCVESVTGRDIRYIYMNTARGMLEDLRNENARRTLSNLIEIWEKDKSIRRAQ